MNPFFRPRDARLRRRQRIPLSLPRSLHGHGKGGGEEVEEPAEKRSILEPILLDRSLSFDEKMRKVDEYFALRCCFSWDFPKERLEIITMSKRGTGGREGGGR
eukprot:1227978-Amorphochlora_amoeboformis.AAC.1